MRRFLIILSFLLSVQPFLAASAAAAEEDQRAGFLEELLSLPVRTVQEVSTSLDRTIFNLGEIKVGSSRLSTAQSDLAVTDIPHSVTVVGTRELEESAASSLPELLSLKEGVTYTDELGHGLNARIDLRGFGGEAKQALVLFDGLRAVEPVDNSVAWHLYPKEYLQRVELHRGGATMFGEGALSGAVVMTTKDPTAGPRAALESSFGDWRTSRSFAEASDTLGPLGVYIGGRYLVTDGYRQNGSHEGASSLWKARFEASDALHFGNSFYFADDETGIPGPLTPAEAAVNRRQKDPDGQFGDQFLDKLVQNAFSTTLYIERLNTEISNVFGARRRDQDSVQSFGGFFGGTSVQEITSHTLSDVFQISTAVNAEGYHARITGGVEWSKDDVHNPSSFNSFSFGPFTSERSVDRLMSGAYVQIDSRIFDRLFIQSGLRRDDVEWDIHDLQTPSLGKEKTVENVSPNLGIEYRLFDPLSVYGSYSEAFKAPDVNTLIFETPNLFTPNPAIDPSTARHYELGVRYAHPVFGSVRAVAFAIETKKEILFNAISTLNENFDTKRRGVELADEIAVAEGVQLFTTYTFTEAEFDNGAFGGKTVPLVPASRWSAGMVLGPFAGWNVTAQAAGNYDAFALNDFNNVFRADDYWTLGLRVARKCGNWEFYVSGDNVLGDEHSTFTTSNGVNTVNVNPAPTSYFEGGFRIEI